MAGYHREHKDTFISRAAGLAAIGGLVALGLTRGAPVLGRAAEALTGSELGQKLLTGVADLVRPGVQGTTQLAGELFSSEGNVLLRGAEAIERGVRTTLTSERRSESILAGFREHTLDKAAFDAPDFQQAVRQILGRVVSAEDPSRIPAGFHTFRGLEHFNTTAAKYGVRFDFESLAQQHNHLMEWVREAGTHTVSQDEVKNYLQKESVQQSVFETLSAARKQFADRTQSLLERFLPNTKKGLGRRHLTFREIWKPQDLQGNSGFDQRAHEAVVRQIQKDMHLPEDRARSFLQQHIENARETLVRVFGDAENSERQQMLWNDFLNSKTGWSINTHGKVFNWHRPAWIAGEALDKTLDQLHIPLIPYSFNVSLRSLRLAPKIKDLAKGLGLVGESPEVRRFLQKAWRHGNGMPMGSTHLVAVGDQLIALGQQEAQHINGRWAVFDARGSSMMRRMAEARSMAPDAPFGGDWKRLKPTSGQSRLQKMLHAFSPHFAVARPVPGGVRMQGRSPIGGILAHYLYGQGVVDPRQIHPALLAEAVGQFAPHNLSPETHYSLISSLVREAGQNLTDSAKELKAYAEWGRSFMPSFGGKDGGQSGTSVLFHMFRDIDNPDNLIYELFRNLGDHQGKSLMELTSEAKEALNPQLYQALQSAQRGYRDLMRHSKGEGNVLHRLNTMWRGESGLSQMSERLQRGLLSQMMSDMGAQRYGGYESLAEEVLRLRDAIQEGIPFHRILSSAPQNHPAAAFAGDLRDKLGVDSLDQLSSVVNRLLHLVKGEPVAHTGHMGELSSLLLDKEQVLGLSDNNLVRAKLLNQLRVGLESWPVSVQARNLHLRNLMFDETNTSEWLTDAVKQRFHMLRSFHPQELGSNPLYDPHTYTVPLNPDWEFSTFLENPAGAVREGLKNGFGLGSWVRAQYDPQQPHGLFSMYQHVLGMIPQSVAENVGLGLPAEDLSTPLRTSLAWWAKRVVPLYVGLEFYKNLNSNAHELGMPGVDDLGANLMANTNLLLASVKDALGITSLAQSAVRRLPGLDQYFHPRSHDEYQEYLFYGEEEVREGRGWFTGSRNPITGGRISYVRPNFYRRWHSHWTEADNVDISNAAHSWLPSPLHPFAPLARAINPDWFVDKHLQDRPYRPGGVRGAGEDPGSYLISNAWQDGEFQVRAGMGGQYPTSLRTPYSPDIMMGGGQGPYGPGTTGGQGGSAEQGSEQVRFAMHKQMREGFIHNPSSLLDLLVHKAQNVRSKAGLIGAFINKLPGFPAEGGIQAQDWRAAISSDRLLFGGEYGELSGSLGEFMRRLINPRNISPNDYNTLPNNQASWLPARFRAGDPLLRSPGGEFNVPGDAAERLNPWYAPLKVRGSALGGSVDEIIQKWLYPTMPLGSQQSEDIVEFGSRAHKLVQRQLSQQGVLIGAEVPIYDEQHNISGTVDAIIRGQHGQEVWDIKTQGGAHWGEVPEKYIDQITAYMAIMGIPRGGLAFVNRDDPDQVRFVSFGFDPNRWERILNRIETARSRVTDMVNQGVISPFETYDILARIDVLSKVAPDSPEFRELVEYAAEGGGFGGFENQRFQQALRRASKLRERYRLYPWRAPSTETHRIKLEGVAENGDLITELGVMHLAGVLWDPQAFGHQDPEDVLASFGVHVGDTLPMTMIKGQYDPELMNDINIQVQVGKLNQRLIKSVYAGPDLDSNHPLAIQAAGYGPGIIGRLWEHLVHTDSMLTNKVMRVRSALEQFERGEVYGTDDFRWSHLFSTLMVPTLHSTASKNPISAALRGAVLGGILLRTKEARTFGAGLGAAAGFSLSTIRALYEAVSGRKWKPRRVRQQEKFDEYWDTLEYVKYATMAEAAARKALKLEGTDIHALQHSPDRENVSLGPWGALAVHAQRRAESTMYGFDELHGTVQQALQVLPQRHRQIAQSIIETGSIKEKRRFYDLLSNSERRVLGRFLGVDESSLPDKPHLTEYFRKHFLPQAGWRGWSSEVDLEDLRVRGEAAENTKVERPNRNRVERARAYTEGIPIPKMKAHTPARIKSTLSKLMSRGSFGRVHAQYVTRPAAENVINVRFDLKHDQTDELIAQAQSDMYGLR